MGDPTNAPADDPADDLTARLAQVLRTARLARGLSTAALAAASGVSRASVVKLERADARPSAALLARLCAPLGLTLSELFSRTEDAHPARRLVRAADAPVWTDPATGHRRRSLSPAPDGPVQLTEIDLPAGACATYPAAAYERIHQQVWVLSGRLDLREGAEHHELAPGDCLELGPARDCTFSNPGTTPVRYLVALARR